MNALRARVPQNKGNILNKFVELENACYKVRETQAGIASSCLVNQKEVTP